MYKTGQINDHSYTDIQKLYFLSFGIRESLDTIRTKYDTQLFGCKNVGVIAHHDGDPAAYYGVFPIVLSWDEKDMLVAQSGDTMTAPAHQKKGLFTRLATETYELAEKVGVQLVFGFPNQNSYPGFKHKLAWRFNGFMQRFTLPVRTLPLCELAAKFSFLRPAYQKYVRGKLASYSLNPESDLRGFDFSQTRGRIRKDKRFFSYKMARENVYLIEKDGYKMLIKVETHLFIGEIARIMESEVDGLLKSITKLAKMLKCKKVIFTYSSNHWMYPFLSKHLEADTSLPIGFFEINKDLDPSDIQFSNADYDTF